MTTQATPYDLTDLCDFARGVCDPRTATEIEAALEHTPRARQAVNLFERVATVARQDALDDVPAHALRVAKAAASVRRPADSAGRRSLPFSLIFDSLLQPAASGTRDVHTSHRLLTFRAADYRIHVRLETETSHSHGQVVVGQLLRQQDTARPVSDAPLLVLHGDDVVGRALTSRFGEFQAVGLPSGPLRLCLLPGRNDQIDIPLGRELEDVGSVP